MPENEGIIEVYKTGDEYCGKILWLKEKEKDGTPLKDRNNPVDSLRNSDIEGMTVMNGFKYQGNATWSGGTFYAAKKGRTVEPDFVMPDEEHLNIVISLFIFSMTVELTRVDTSEFFTRNKEYRINNK
jgi:hypothetical protein